MTKLVDKPGAFRIIVPNGEFVEHLDVFVECTISGALVLKDEDEEFMMAIAPGQWLAVRKLYVPDDVPAKETQ